MESLSAGENGTMREHLAGSSDDSELINNNKEDSTIGTSYSDFSYLYDTEEIYNDDGNEVVSESLYGQDYAEWIFDQSTKEEEVEFDLSNEQALATLKYFTSTADRTNMMTKFHSNDLDLISQLLNDKEKDLEMAAKIGQSLLQRNKSLMEKIEKMEDYLSNTKDNEEQLKYDLHQKNQLMKIYMEEDDERRSSDSDGSKYDACDDEELMNLTRRCRNLEKENHELFSEALSVRQITDEIEEKEESLVFDCIEQITDAKLQITKLTDEIAQKFEDNVQQQEEITQLINMVVELQKKQKQLSVENEDLQSQLFDANQNQSTLLEQLNEMQEKFRETRDMLQENQQELRQLKSRMEYPTNAVDWLNDSINTMSLQDSLANEIEESVRRDLTNSQEQRRHDKKVLDNVRFLNTKSQEPYSRTTSGRASPVSNWSVASDERSDATSIMSMDFDGNRIRKPARKLQIVKPMEGSDTLHKWHHLASENVRGGLNISENENSPTPKVEKPLNTSLDDDRSTVVDEDKTLPTAGTAVEGSTDGDIISPPKIKPQKQNAHEEGKSLFNNLNTPIKTKRTIITRNSSALNSLRRGRKMLQGNGGESKSKSEVIDMIASAMSKVNVEKQTGNRILASLNKPNSSNQERGSNLSRSPEYKDYKGMPTVSRVLEKAAHARESEESEGTLSPVLSPKKVDISSSKDIPLTSIKEKNSTPSREKKIKTILPDNALNSMSGPLGLLDRADPLDTNKDIMDRLYRLSGHDTNALHDRSLTKQTTFDTSDELDFDSGVSTAGSVEGSGIRRNKSSGSLVDMMMSNKLQSGIRNPFGLSTLVNASSNSALNGAVSVSALKDSSSKSVEGLSVKSFEVNDTSKSVETGLDTVKKIDNTSETPSSGYGGFFSFLGKFT